MFTQMNGPLGGESDGSGNLYIADTYNRLIYQVNLTTGIITTIAGRGTRSLGDGGPAISAELDDPSGVVLDGSGNLYIADAYDSLIRKISLASGVITTVSGGGPFPILGDGRAATGAYLNLLGGVTVDSSGNLYIADTNNDLIRKVTASIGFITTVEFSTLDIFRGYSGDGGRSCQ